MNTFPCPKLNKGKKPVIGINEQLLYSYISNKVFTSLFRVPGYNIITKSLNSTLWYSSIIIPHPEQTFHLHLAKFCWCRNGHISLKNCLWHPDNNVFSSYFSTHFELESSVKPKWNSSGSRIQLGWYASDSFNSCFLSSLGMIGNLRSILISGTHQT